MELVLNLQAFPKSVYEDLNAFVVYKRSFKVYLNLKDLKEPQLGVLFEICLNLKELPLNMLIYRKPI